MTSIWREPAETTEEYPGLFVCDNRVTGSITLSESRLPLWAFTGRLTSGGWDLVEHDWDNVETDYGWTADRFAEFLHDLLEARGDFGRLLLAIANAERLEQERHDQAIEEQAPGQAVVRIALNDDDEGVHLPLPWHMDAELSKPVLELLRRCIASLEGLE